MLLLSLGSMAQITTLNPGQASSTEGAQRLLGQCHKGLRTSGASVDKEIYVGVPDLEVAANRAESDLTYLYTIHFKLTYDVAADQIVTVTTIRNTSVTTTKNNISATVVAAGKSITLSKMNFMEMQLRTQNATCAIDVDNLTLNGQPFSGPYTRANASGSSYWHLLDYDFGAGFQLTGTITITGNFGTAIDANKVEFIFGSLPGKSTVNTLPLVWGNIGVKRNLSRNNELVWTTLQEFNSESFLIQRSEDGRSFQTIGRRTATGNSVDASTYVFEDVDYQKDAYYRIIEVNADGKPSYSKIVSIKGSSLSTVFYNGSNKLIVQSTDKTQKFLKVTDVLGKLFISTSIKDTNATVDVSNLSRGIYFVQLEGNAGGGFRFMKQ